MPPSSAHAQSTPRPSAFAAAAAWAVTAILLGCGDSGGGSPDPTSILAFVAQPATTAAFTPMPADVRVEVRDEEGTVIADSTAVVTLRIAQDSGRLLLRASGTGDLDPTPMTGSRLLELVDAATGSESPLYRLEYVWPKFEPTSLGYDAASDQIHLNNRLQLDFFTGDPRTGQMQTVGVGTTDNVKGMAYEPVTDGRLLAVLSKNSGLLEDALHEIDPTTGSLTTLGTITPDQGRIVGFNGLAFAPDGTLYAAVTLGQLSLTGRALMEIDTSDEENLTANLLCELQPSSPADSARVAAIAVTGDGTILALTGDSAGNPPAPPDPPSNASTLYSVTVPAPSGVIEDCGMTELIGLGAPANDRGNDGETLVAVATHIRGGVSGGEVNVAAVNGVATFSALQLDGMGTGFTLEATASNATVATSDPFDISMPTRSHDVQFEDAMDSSDEGGVGEDTIVTYRVENASGGTHAHDVIVTISVGSDDADDVNGSVPDTDLDYTKYAQVTIPAGATGADGDFTIIGDDVSEPDETITFYIEDASLADGIGTPDTLVYTIVDDDSQDVHFEMATDSAIEGAAGEDMLVAFRVEITGGGIHAHDVTVTISVDSDDADDLNGVQPDTDLDYTKFAEVTIPAGATGANGEFTIIGDDAAESDETITFIIEGASQANGIGTPDTLVYTIVDDDSP